MSTPAILTTREVRQWLRAIGLKGVRLPRTVDRVVYVDDPQARGLWRISLHGSGAYLVEPYRTPDEVEILKPGSVTED